MLEVLFPAVANNHFRGMMLPLYLFVLTASVGTVRSLIHLLAPDGGAGTIAGMDLSVPGRSGIVFAFALWGSSQLIYALIQLLVAFRYRSLVPFMWLMITVETPLRILVGQMKPVRFAHTPPGEIANYLYLPLSIVMFLVCLWSGSKDNIS
jgi:hypothetical protein